MTTRRIAWGLGAVLAAGSLAGMARAQEGLPLPPQVEKDLAAKASDVTEVTLGKNMLDFAAKFLDDKDEDQAATRKLIQGLKGIYVREYDFDKEGDYSMDQLQQLRNYFETSEWTPVVRERERNLKETTDVMMKMVNGEPQGMFILEADPRELTIVLILGPIRMEELSKLGGVAGLGDALGPLSGAHHSSHAKAKDKTNKKGDDE
ncbi:MAG TPA: DUF4252 domain-containing protein [Terracidiphilus sp.]|nr:DUF4252 domain-containing protein [Terracidiphilus sp.]